MSLSYNSSALRRSENLGLHLIDLPSEQKNSVREAIVEVWEYYRIHNAEPDVKQYCDLCPESVKNLTFLGFVLLYLRDKTGEDQLRGKYVNIWGERRCEEVLFLYPLYAGFRDRERPRLNLAEYDRVKIKIGFIKRVEEITNVKGAVSDDVRWFDIAVTQKGEVFFYEELPRFYNLARLRKYKLEGFVLEV